MRGGLLLSAAVAAVAGTVLVGGVLVKVVTDQAAAQAQGVMNLSCDAAIGPTRPGDAVTASSQVNGLTGEQRQTASLIVSVGKGRNLSPRAWQVAIQAGMTESGLRNLNYGDADSLGIFQMRPSMGWGTVAQLQDPVYEIDEFYDVLLAIPGWDQERPGSAAQAVERSAFPDRYHRWEQMAAYLVENVGQVTNVTGCGQSVGLALPGNQAAAGAIQFALSQLGKPYLWGGTGPNAYDCSGLMLKAYQAGGITLDRVAADQYRDGAMLPVRTAQPGDLLFWGYDPSNPATIHHVAMYLGNGKIVEAQQDGVPVHVRPVSFDEKELVPQAVRPGV